MKICGSGFHIQANYPDFNKKIEKFESKLNQLESRLVENCSLVEVSIIHDQIVEIKSEAMLQFSLHGIQLSSDLMNIAKEENITNFNTKYESDEKSRNSGHRRNRSSRNKSQKSDVSSETEKEECKLTRDDTKSISNIFKKVLDSYSEKIKIAECEVPLIDQKNDEIKVNEIIHQEKKENSNFVSFLSYIKVLIFLNFLLIFMLVYSLVYQIQNQMYITEKLVEFASRIPTNITIDPTLFMSEHFRPQYVEVEKVTSHPELAPVKILSEEMNEEDKRLDKINKFIDFYDLKTGRKSNRNESEFEFETTFNYIIDQEIRKALKYKPFKKIRKLEVLNLKNYDKNLTGMLFGFPFAENFYLGGNSSNLFRVEDHLAAVERLCIHANNLTSFYLAEFSNKALEVIIKGNAGTETEIIIKAISECQLRTSLYKFIVTECGIETSKFEELFDKYGMKNITVIAS